MSEDLRTALERDQDDCLGRLSADPFFVDVPVLLQKKGDIEADVATALTTLNEKTGKIGAVVIILEPAERDGAADAPGPEYTVALTLQVIVTRVFNDGDSGTGKSAGRIADKIKQLLHRVPLGSGACYTYDRGFKIDDVAEGSTSRAVAFKRRAMDDEETRCGLPLFTPDTQTAGSNIALETATAGAAIYYSTDGSYPSAAGAAASPPTSTLYIAPFTAAAGVTVRAAAEKSGLQQSGVAQLTFA